MNTLLGQLATDFIWLGLPKIEWHRFEGSWVRILAGKGSYSNPSSNSVAQLFGNLDFYFACKATSIFTLGIVYLLNAIRHLIKNYPSLLASTQLKDQKHCGAQNHL